MTDDKTKRCPQCGRVLPLDRFSPDRWKGEHRVQAYCKECIALRKAKYARQVSDEVKRQRFPRGIAADGITRNGVTIRVREPGWCDPLSHTRKRHVLTVRSDDWKYEMTVAVFSNEHLAQMFKEGLTLMFRDLIKEE